MVWAPLPGVGGGGGWGLPDSLFWDRVRERDWLPSPEAALDSEAVRERDRRVMQEEATIGRQRGEESDGPRPSVLPRPPDPSNRPPFVLVCPTRGCGVRGGGGARPGHAGGQGAPHTNCTMPPMPEQGVDGGVCVQEGGS